MSPSTVLGLSARQHLHALRWIGSAPSLLSDRCTEDAPGVTIKRWSPAERQAHWQWCDRLDVDHLIHALGPEPAASEPALRLGRYAERLMHYLLRFGPSFELIAAHLPLRIAQPQNNRTTAGEIDFLLKDRSGACWHWELAIKLFLFEPRPDCLGTALPSDFRGPDRKDSLELKLGKLLGKQLRQPVPASAGPGPWMAAALALGWMFYPWGHALPQTDALAQDHLQGHWIGEDELDSMPGGNYLIVPRIRWMAPVLLESSDAVVSRDQVAAALASRKGWAQGRAQLLARIDTATGLETARFFVRPRSA